MCILSEKKIYDVELVFGMKYPAQKIQHTHTLTGSVAKITYNFHMVYLSIRFDNILV